MKTILYVDDDTNSLFLVKEQLKFIDPNINIITESNSEDAIELFNDYINDISLIILDVQLPNLTGYDLLLMFKKLNSEIPIIMITASTGNREYDYVIKKLGASEYLIKPLSKKLLSEIVEKY